MRFSVVFVALSGNLPQGGEAMASGFHQKVGVNQWKIWVVAGAESEMKDGTGQYVRGLSGTRSAQDIADTVFHEILHVWFKTMFPGQGTGHNQRVQPPEKK